MPDYLVRLSRPVVATESATAIVAAANENEAREIAMKQTADLLLDWDVTDVGGALEEPTICSIEAQFHNEEKQS